MQGEVSCYWLRQGGGLLVIVVSLMIFSTTRRFNKVYESEPEAMAIAADAASIALSEHWAERHFQVCHGQDLGGGPFFEDPALGFIDALNLTAGCGGIGRTNTEAGSFVLYGRLSGFEATGMVGTLIVER